MRWYEARTWVETRYRLFKSISRVRMADEPWARRLVNLGWLVHGRTINEAIAARSLSRSRAFADRRVLRKVARMLADDESLRAAFDSFVRLARGNAAVKRWLRDTAFPPPPPAPPEVRKARAREAIAKKVTKREEHARRMLAKHERRLAIEKRAVARWARKVAAIERRKAKPTRTHTPAEAAACPVAAPSGSRHPKGHPHPENASQAPARARVAG